VRYCTRFPVEAEVGAVWTALDWRGEPITLSVEPGVDRR
jgi:hypothetical protein